MSVHIEAKPGDIAPVVLLPGDPLRAQFIAKRFLEDAVCHNRVRNALGYTGSFRGRRVSVQSTGMGMPSMSIYAHELLSDYGVRVLLRVGTCGALQPDIKLRELVLAMSASTDSAMNRRDFGSAEFAPTADFELLRRAHTLAGERRMAVRAGSVLTSDAFYLEDPEWWRVWAKHGVLAAEMETAALYTLAARFGARALSMLTVSDHIATGERCSSEDRRASFLPMLELALELGASFA
jgi:purine-nucleoside phosphorylase